MSRKRKPPRKKSRANAVVGLGLGAFAAYSTIGTPGHHGAVPAITASIISRDHAGHDTRTTAIPARAAAAAISYARNQIGKPYQWGGTGPDAFDCSGLVMKAYHAAGITIERTSQAQWATLPHVSPSQVQPGDLVFFAGADGTTTSPGHVGLVIGHGQMIEAYATGFPIRIATYTNRDPVGFARPEGGAR